MAKLDSWQEEGLQACIKQVCERLELKLNKVGPPLRVAVTGSAMSPSLEVTLKLIGRERSLKRILKAVEFNRAKYA